MADDEGKGDVLPDGEMREDGCILRSISEVAAVSRE